MKGGARVALAVLGLITAITISWWALALWPLPASAPEWLARTRLVCFGSTSNGLPTAGGWLLLIGQPMGMLLVLFAVWGDSIRDGMRALASRMSGQLVLGGSAAVLVLGGGGVAWRVAGPRAEAFFVNDDQVLAAQLSPVNDAAPALRLVDQTGVVVDLASFRGRPVLLTFAFGHCETVCPTLVLDVLRARRKLTDANPAVLIVTLDPWRDTPGRLASIASAWGVTGDAHVLSGAVDSVEQVLTAWRIPRVRNPTTGDITHPSVIYVIGRDGRIHFVLQGQAEVIMAAVRSLT